MNSVRRDYALLYGEAAMLKRDKQLNDVRIKRYKKITARATKNKYKNGANARKLGFIPLNKPFDGSAGHHIDRENVIFIPKALHDSVFHCSNTGVGMAKINRLAIEFLLGGKK